VYRFSLSFLSPPLCSHTHTLTHSLTHSPAHSPQSLRDQLLCVVLVDAAAKPLGLSTPPALCTGTSLTHGSDVALAAMQIHAGTVFDWVVGSKHVLLRDPQVEARLEATRLMLMHRAASRVQRWVMGRAEKKRFFSMMDVVLEVSRRNLLEKQKVRAVQDAEANAYKAKLTTLKKNTMRQLNLCARYIQRMLRARAMRRVNLCVGVCERLKTALEVRSEAQLNFAIGAGVRFLEKFG